MAQKPSVVSVKSLFIPCNFNKIPGVFGKISSSAKSDAQCCKDSFFTDRKANRFSGKFHILYICFRRKTHAHSLHTKFYTGLRVPASNRYTGLDTGAIQGFKTSFPVVCSGKWRIKGSLASVDRSILGYWSEGD